MTTLDTLGTEFPSKAEVFKAALAMADFDGKFGDYAIALEWLDAAESHFPLPSEYEEKRRAWQRKRQPNSVLILSLARRTVLPT